MDEETDCVMALPQVPLFSPLDNKQLIQIAQAMYEQTFDAGEDIILQVNACAATDDDHPSSSAACQSHII